MSAFGGKAVVFREDLVLRLLANSGRGTPLVSQQKGGSSEPLILGLDCTL